MVKEDTRITIPAKISCVEKATSFMISELEKRQYQTETIQRLELALEEMLVNVASYAYPDSSGDATVIISFSEDDEVIIEIIDEGIPYDPTKSRDPEVTKPLKQRGKGGLGIFMAKSFVDDMRYFRKDECNHTIMIKRR